jgi:hypothetical protein
MIINSFPTLLQNGTVEDATQVMTLFSWIQAQVNGNACGSTTGTVILKGDGSGNTLQAIAGVDYVSGLQLQNSTLTFLTSVAGTNVITGNLTPAIASYVAGQMFSFLSAGANTGAVTLNINGVGAKAVTKLGSTALAAGDIPANTIIIVQYDGSEFQLVAPAALSSLGSMAFQNAGSVAITGGTIAGTFTGPLTGNVTGNVSGSSGSCIGNAATATLSTDSTNAIGYNQTWQNVTSSRTAGTTYTNSSGKPIMVKIVTSVISGSYTTQLLINGNVVDTQLSTSYVIYTSVSAIIPPNSTYSLSLTNGVLQTWYELR